MPVDGDNKYINAMYLRLVCIALLLFHTHIVAIKVRVLTIAMHSQNKLNTTTYRN